MNDSDLNLAYFKTLIEQRLADLEQLLQDAESRSQSVELDQSKVGRLSRMDALQQQAMSDAIRSRALRERTRLQLAMKSWQEGEYGWCSQCGEMIAPGRLEFDPAASLCIACATGNESR